MAAGLICFGMVRLRLRLPRLCRALGIGFPLDAIRTCDFIFLSSFLSMRSRHHRAKTFLGGWVDGDSNGLIRDSLFF
jgi:hypothetical protein